MSPFCRCTCSACGRTLSSAKRWKVSRTAGTSSPRCRGPSGGSQRRAPPGRARQRGRRPPAPPHPASTPHRGSRPATLPASSATTSATNRTAMRVSVSVLAVLEGSPRGGDCGPRHPRRRRRLPGWRRCRRVSRTAACLVDEALGQVDRFGGTGQHGRRGRGHGARPLQWLAPVRLSGVLPLRVGGRRRSRAAAGRPVRPRGQPPSATPGHGHRSGADAGGRLGPGVDDLEAPHRDQPREDGADVGVAGVGHQQWPSAYAPGACDGLLCDDPPPGTHRSRMRNSTTAGSTTCMRRKRQKARSTGSGSRRSSAACVTATT